MALVYGLLMGIAIYLGTAAILGTKRTASLPGGAVGAVIFVSPWYLAIPGALIGHFGCVLLQKKLAR